MSLIPEAYEGVVRFGVRGQYDQFTFYVGSSKRLVCIKLSLKRNLQNNVQVVQL